ncbi:glutamate 5-kinase [Galbibacter mesophilus]|uniref:glutamate 5-kinase n=1 Tax=Galbibacter mesophilus TaxID=379069 RepID=UPI00191F2593|nr:glutamate 5-kinase [Galbibacter mesophilus]MCM5662897.1 glutamate 5-kinase [Galbibacter mesophilus]
MSKPKKKKKRILLKIGSNTLTKESDQISRGKLEDIGRQIAELQDDYEFVIVSSGAKVVAKQFVNLESTYSEDINVKQALTSIGQPHLIRIFQESFRELGLLASQCLLSYSDFEKDVSKENIVNTINILVDNGYIPIINENDTVATDEIQFGDNDKLAALTAALLKVDLLIIATNTNGIYTKQSFKDGSPETIEEVENFSDLKKEVVDEDKSSHGTGGMSSKVIALEIANKANIETWIVNGLEDNFILNTINQNTAFTKIE